MRICYVIPSLSQGGTERQLSYLVGGLAGTNQVTVVCTHHEGAFVGDVRRAGADVRVIYGHGGWDFTLIFKLRQLFRRHPPDIVHTFLFGFDLYANLAARQAGVPIVISSRRQLGTWRKERHVLMQKMGNRFVDCIVANSGAVARFAADQEQADISRYRVIYNGIDPALFMGHTDHRTLRLRYRLPFHVRLVGIAANFSPVKDHGLFIDMAYELLRRRADVHFVMVGSGPLVQAIERKIEHGGTPDCFTRISAINEIFDIYSLLDVSVLCSQVEGFPNAMMESMTAGTPVVAAAVGGVPELIRHNETGLLVHTREPRDFADAVEQVLDHTQESAAMAARAQAFVAAELSIEKMVAAYRSLYTELLTAHSKRKS